MRFTNFPPIAKAKNAQTIISTPITIQANGPADFRRRLASYGVPLNAM